MPATVGGRLAAVLLPAAVVLLFGAVAIGWAAQRQDSEARDADLHFRTATLSQQIATNWLYTDALAGGYIANPTADTRLAVQQEEDQISQDLRQLRGIETGIGTPEELVQIDSAIAQTAAIEEVRTSFMNTVDQGDINTAGAILLQEIKDSRPALAQL